METIQVRGSKPVDVEILHTEWGPVVWKDGDGRQWAMHWTALQPDAVNLKLFDLEKCRTLEEVFETVNACRLPVMNCVAGDVSGRVGWTLFGSVPKRVSAKHIVHYRTDQPDQFGKRCLSQMKSLRWFGARRDLSGTANNRVMGDDVYQRMCTGTHVNGSRAYQIREFFVGPWASGFRGHDGITARYRSSFHGALAGTAVELSR